jgi:hypothetical protein
MSFYNKLCKYNQKLLQLGGMEEEAGAGVAPVIQPICTVMNNEQCSTFIDLVKNASCNPSDQNMYNFTTTLNTINPLNLLGLKTVFEHILNTVNRNNSSDIILNIWRKIIACNPLPVINESLNRLSSPMGDEWLFLSIIRYGNEILINDVLNNGFSANVNAFKTTGGFLSSGQFENSILFTAVQTGNVNIVRMLVNRGAHPTYLGFDYRNILIENSIKMADFNMCEYLISTFHIIPDIYSDILEGEGYIEEYHMGIYSKDKLLDFLYNIIGLLIRLNIFSINNIYNHDGDVIGKDGVDEMGVSALHIAVANRNECLIQVLVKLGINKRIRDENGQTALLIASGQHPEFSEDILAMLSI